MSNNTKPVKPSNLALWALLVAKGCGPDKAAKFLREKEKAPSN